MRKKISLFLLLSIISIFGSIREEVKDRAHLYTFVNSEIKEKQNQRKDKHILLNTSNKNSNLISTVNRDRKDDGNDDNTTTYLINSNFSPIFNFSLNRDKILKFY
ncbi:hypothetical protein, partial [Cetobacterium sp.]|uniref:hypothetical protein n=1 Tax=Cetobacterium sp. TaxID=2071632 RepID=UPI003AF1978B